jgi:hypothetical protein
VRTADPSPAARDDSHGAFSASTQEFVMSDLAQVILKDLAAYYEMVREQTHHWVEPLSEEQL